MKSEVAQTGLVRARGKGAGVKKGSRRIFLCGVALVFFVAAVSAWIARNTLHAHERLHHTRELLNALHATLTDLLDFETSYRGYILTGDRSFLEPYFVARPLVAQRLAQLGSLVSEDESQARLFAHLKEQVEGKIKFGDALLEKPWAERSSAAKRLLSEGKLRMDEIRRTLAAVRADEEEELEQAILEFRQRLLWLSGIIALFVALSATMLSWSYFALEKESRLKSALEERARRLLDSSPDAMIVADVRGTILHSSLQATLTFGLTADELRGKNLTSLAPKPLRRHYGALFRHYVKNPRRWPMGNGLEIVALRNGTSEFPAEMGLSPVESDEGLTIVCSLRDITLRKQMEERYHRALERFEQVFTYSTDPIGYADLEGRFLDVNPAFCDLTGFTKEELLGGKTYQDLTPEEFLRVEGTVVARVVGKGESVEYEKECRGKDGRRVPVLVTAFLVRDGDGRGKGFGAILKDVTERKLSEAKRRAQSEELARSNQDLERFAYVASHEMQEPLRMVKCYLSLLDKRNGAALDRTSREFLHYAIDGARRSSEIIASLLTYARVGYGPIEVGPTDCNRVLRDVLSTLDPAIRESGAIVDARELPTVKASPESLERVFRNFISNAIKYRSDRPPRIEISARPLGNGWEIAVRDNGLGIPEEAQGRLFEIFQRFHGREIPGLGIGLATVKRTLERLGGTLTFSSILGQGSVFRFVLPRAERADQPQLPAGPSAILPLTGAAKLLAAFSFVLSFA